MKRMDHFFGPLREESSEKIGRATLAKVTLCRAVWDR